MLGDGRDSSYCIRILVCLVLVHVDSQEEVRIRQVWANGEPGPKQGGALILLRAEKRVFLPLRCGGHTSQ